jgi:hypothetical protein
MAAASLSDAQVSAKFPAFCRVKLLAWSVSESLGLDREQQQKYRQSALEAEIFQQLLPQNLSPNPALM